MSSGRDGTPADKPVPQGNAAMRWCFTWHHYTEACQDRLAAPADLGFVTGTNKEIRDLYVVSQEVVPITWAPTLVGFFVLVHKFRKTGGLRYRDNLTAPGLVIARGSMERFVRSCTRAHGANRGSIVIHGRDPDRLPRWLATLREADDMSGTHRTHDRRANSRAVAGKKATIEKHPSSEQKSSPSLPARDR